VTIVRSVVSVTLAESVVALLTALAFGFLGPRITFHNLRSVFRMNEPFAAGVVRSLPLVVDSPLILVDSVFVAVAGFSVFEEDGPESVDGN